MTRKRRDKRRQGRQVRLPGIGMVHLAPARESRTPFCAYYDPKGEICYAITGLKLVLTLSGPVKYTYIACPELYEAVSQRVQVFLASIVNGSQ